MSDESLRPEEKRTAIRVPFIAEVRLEFENLAGFVREYSDNLSIGGMFIKTDHPKPLGTEIRFEVQLADSTRIVHGTGVVVWARAQAQGAEQPAGMGVRFLEVDAESRDFIFRIVDRFIHKGGEPFDLDAPA